MARARNIKPGFFLNEELVELPFSTRLFFIGLWTLADREGRLEDKPKKIKMHLFPADDLSVDSALNDLEESGFLLRYEADGNRFIQILAFAKHQNPHRDEKPSTIPAPCKHPASTAQEQSDNGGDRADSLIPDSLPLIPDSGLLIADTAPVPVAPATPKKSRKAPNVSMPDNFAISNRVRAWAREKGIQNLERHFEHFVGSCKAKGYVYADWDEGFMGAVRSDWARLSPQARGSPIQVSADEVNRQAKEMLFGKSREVIDG